MKSIEKLNVLFCIPTLGGGGAEKLLIDVLNRIDDTRFTVDLCLLYSDGVYFDAIPDHVNWFVCEDYPSFSSRSYDIEIAFLEGPATRFIAFHPTSAVKIAWVHTDLYNNQIGSGVYKNHYEEALCYSMMDQIVFVSQTSMQQFDKMFPGIDVNKKVIYNLIDKAEIITRSQAADCPIEKTKLTLCCIGRLVPIKGFDRLIPILSRLKSEGLDFHCWMIGDGFQKNLVQNLIEQHELEETVFLLGFLANPHPYLRASDIFVSTSFAEGLPLVIGETLCLGKPIVATSVSGTAELLGYGKYGMLVDSDDESLYHGLKEMISNESLRTFYAQKAMEGSATDIFDLQNNLDQIHNLIYHITSTKTPLDRIAKHLFIDNSTRNDPGLLYGKTGKAIFFFHHYILTGNKIYEEYALTLIDEMSGLVHRKTPVVYENGLAGIGTGIEYLVQNKFIEGNTNDILEDFDKRLYTTTIEEPCSNFTLLSGYMGYARYWMFRLNNPRNQNIRENSQIIQSLNHILSVIDTRVSEIESDEEQQDVYRFLGHIKQFPLFTERANMLLDRYFSTKYFQVDDRQYSGYIKSNPINNSIRDCLLKGYERNPLTNIIWDELFYDVRSVSPASVE